MTHGEDAHHRLVRRLREQAEDVRRLTSGLTEDQIAARTVDGKWSVKELVCHLRRLQDVFAARVDAMLTRDRPAFESYEPDDDPVFDEMVRRPAIESINEFLTGRDRFAGRLATLDRREWHRGGAHPKWTPYDVHFAVEYMLHHEAHHIYQMLERRLPLGPLPH
jgi:hypothetical protein